MLSSGLIRRSSKAGMPYTIYDLRRFKTMTWRRRSLLSERSLPPTMARGMTTFRVLVEGTPRSLDPILRDEIYRIVREALRNAFHYAQARRIETEITYGDPLFRLRVRDDGNGIDPEVLGQGSRAGHWGLPGMHERAKRIGGELNVWSRPGAGTEVELTIPGSIAYGGSPDRAGFRLTRK